MAIYINGQLQVDGISPTFNDVTISGDLTVNGTTTTINSTTFEATELTLTPTSGEGLTVRESDDGNDAIRLKGFGAAGQLNILSAGVNTIQLSGNGNSFFTGGNVGIGTTSPDYSLHLSRSDTSEIFGITNSGTGGGTIEQGVSNDSFGIGGNKYYFTTSTAASAYLVMDLDDGNVGIGTTSPGAKLAVKTAEADDALFINKDNFGSVLVIDQDVSSDNPCYGVEMNIANTGTGLEYAFKFDGSEIVGSAVGGSQDKKIRVNIAGTDYFIPLHTA